MLKQDGNVIGVTCNSRTNISPFKRQNSSVLSQCVSNEEESECNTFSSLPCEITIIILAFLTAKESCKSVAFVSKNLRGANHSNSLWKERCIQTGKINTRDLCSKSFSSNQSALIYRKQYYRTPCVPLDFSTITEAIANCTYESNHSTITIMPGTYYENISVNSNNTRNLKLTIRAADTQKGAALIYESQNEDKNMDGCNFDQPCVSINNEGTNQHRGSRHDDENINYMVVHLSHLQLLHSTPGADIWNGNCAIVVNGKTSSLILDACTLQSDSGRGIVVSNGASLTMNNTVIHDCAATGCYIGDIGSRAHINCCNIIRNGDGSQNYLHSQRAELQGNDQLGEMQEFANNNMEESRSSLDDSIINDMFIPANFQHHTVPPGHSGMYIETGSAILKNTLVASNSLTGLSVVRGGLVQISECDIADNGSQAVTLVDIHDMNAEIGHMHLNDIHGSLVDKGGNNYESIHPNDPEFCRRNRYSAWEMFNSYVRKSSFPHVITDFMTERKLHVKHCLRN